MEAWAVTRRAKMAMNRSCNFAIVLIFRSIIEGVWKECYELDIER